MYDRFAQKLDRLNAQKQRLIDMVWAVPDSQRVLHPKDGSFSPVEMLMHMALLESNYADILDETPIGRYEGSVAKPGFIYNFVLKRMKEAKASPAPKQTTPKWVPGVDEAIKEWDKQRERLTKHLEVAKPAEIWVIAKPLGKMSADHALDLMAAHHHYHIERFTYADMPPKATPAT
ncbi:MAG: DinB family protein [Chthonomonas sp.]|nr:DinB family protein [Chthonomonas sp.]